VRNTVVPDGVPNSWDAPMPQALVDFKISGLGNVAAPSLSELDKGNLGPAGTATDGYGYTGSPKAYNSPFYQMEIPSHPSIPSNDYAWASWDSSTSKNGPYDMWTDLKIRDFGVENDESSAATKDLDVEVYSDNHGIAGVYVDAIGKSGSVDIVATVDYPASLKKGKYGPVESDKIPVEWGLVEFDPDFEGVPRDCSTAECDVTFRNMTEGGTKDAFGNYKMAQWQFGDGQEVFIQAPANTMQPVTHTYLTEGIFNVQLTMTDAENMVAFQVEREYITIGDGSSVGQTQHWKFTLQGFYPQFLTPLAGGVIGLDSIDPATIPGDVQGVYWFDQSAKKWDSWALGAFDNTLQELVPGQPYMVTVTGACDWYLTLP